MTTNRKKLLMPETMARAGWDLLAGRDDVEGVPCPIALAGAALRERLGEASGVALGPTPFGEAELAAAPRLEVVGRIGVGYDSVDVAACTRRGIPLMVVGTANSVSVAEEALFLMLELAKRGRAMDALVREGRWWEKFQNLPGDLYEKTVLIVGFGRIGTRTARRCLGFEMTVLVHDPYVLAAAIRAAGCVPAPDLDRATAEADFISLHCPKNRETTGLFDAARLARMKPSAVLVNTARGGIVDEVALAAALREGRLAGAGIDVFASEPAATDHPLLALPEVVVAPHVAGVTRESVARMAVATVRNLLSVLDGAPIRENAINPEVLG